MIEKCARRKDNYRPLFCETSFYKNHLSQFSVINRSIQHLNLKQQITVWIICCSCLRRPKSWYSGKQSLQTFKHDARPFKLFFLFGELGIVWPKSLDQEISLDEFCRTVRITPLPQAALNALYYFYVDKYPLEVLSYEPKPLELLKLQMKGKRVLTFERDFNSWPDLKYGARDVLSFWLHDLIHAEHFLSAPEKLRGQIGFYFFVHEILVSKVLEPLLLNSEFNDSFSYIVSDMNSHPIHLIQTLKAHIQIHESQQNAENLTWKRVSELPLFNANTEMQQILDRVNSCDFTEIDAKKLTDFFELDLYQFTLS